MGAIDDRLLKQLEQNGRLKAGRRGGDSSGGGGHTGGGNPPGGNDLEARIAALEKSLPDVKEKLTIIVAKLDSIEKNTATKSDLANTELSILKWCIGTALAMAGLVCAATFGLTKLLSS
jgi:hypothetical protein